MNLFPDRQHVRLRSLELDTYYLHADEDGVSVCINGRRHSMNATWTVHIDHRDGGPHLLFQSAAYGRYLASTNAPAPSGHLGFNAVQRDYDQSVMPEIRWVPIRAGSASGILLRDVTGFYLRANGKYFRWNTGVTVESRHIDNVSTMMRWIVEPIPVKERTPLIPGPTQTRVPLFGRAPRVWWNIRFVRANPEGRYTDRGWTTFIARGRSVYHLRNTLATRVGVVDIHGQRRDIAICVRPGRYGRASPLVVDLPYGRSGETLQLIVLLSETPGYNLLRYPNVNAA